MRNDPTGRALQLLSLLQTQRLWSCSELAARLDVTERTVHRDVDRLRELDYPVESTSGRYGGYRLAPGGDLPPLLLDDDDTVAVAVGLRYSAGTAIDGMDEISLRALAKLERLLPERLRRRVSALHDNVSSIGRAPLDDAVVAPDVLGVLAAACRDGEFVRFSYRARDAEPSRRLVEPHRLVTSERRWYLLAWDHDRADWRTFRLDRVTDARPVGRRFEPRPPPNGDAAHFVARSITSRSHALAATLEIGGSLADVADTLRWIDHTVRGDGENGALVHVRGEDVGRLALSVARIALTNPVTVLDPPELADAIRGLAGNLAPAPSR
jgi:predicted DNA-binding transcriptional regulator YafY